MSNKALKFGKRLFRNMAEMRKSAPFRKKRDHLTPVEPDEEDGARPTRRSSKG